MIRDATLAGLDVGSPAWFERQLRIIDERPLVRRTYRMWYDRMLSDVATAPDTYGLRVLELGSGAGYAKTIDPTIITSDIVEGGADLQLDARSLPFPDASLRAIMLTHVFHHIPDVERFLSEAQRTIVRGGAIAMIDVAHTPLSRFLFGRFHHEPYDSRANGWSLTAPDGTISDSNQALTWIVFHRDRAAFEARYPDLKIECCELLPWFGYLVSGGVTNRSLVPRALAPAVMAADDFARAANPICALHWHIRLRRL